jgi:hypothetical protein
MAKNYEKNPADFHGSAFTLARPKANNTIITFHHLNWMFKHRSLKRYHLCKFSFNKLRKWLQRKFARF